MTFSSALIFCPVLRIEDYNYLLASSVKISENTRRSFELIQSAIILSANILDTTPRQLAQQLWGRLISHKSPEIQKILDSLREQKKCSLASISYF